MEDLLKLSQLMHIV